MCKYKMIKIHAFTSMMTCIFIEWPKTRKFPFKESFCCLSKVENNTINMAET